MAPANEKDRSVVTVRKLISEIVRDNKSKPESGGWISFLKNAEIVSLNRNTSPLNYLKTDWAQLLAMARNQMVVEKLTIEIDSKCETIIDKSMSSEERAQALSKMKSSAAPMITVQGEIGGIWISMDSSKKRMLKDALQKTARAVFVATQVESGLLALLKLKPEDEGEESLVVIGKTHAKIVWERSWYRLSLTDRIRTTVPHISEYDIFLETPLKSSRD